MNPGSTASAHTGDPLALLTLPSFSALSEQQVRGITCVWDGVTLTPATAVDLGPRDVKQLGEKCQWYPRGCITCVVEHAMRALMDHAVDCSACVGNAAGCDMGAALRRIAMRQGRR